MKLQRCSFQIASVVLFTALMLGFQNCGQNFNQGLSENGSVAKLPSPFAESKVVIDYDKFSGEPRTRSVNGKVNKQAQKQVVKSVPAQSQLVVLINNMCAIGFCERTENKESLACKLYAKYHHPEMQNLKQAYVWVLDRDMSEDDIKSEIESNEANAKCIVGVSQRETYKIKQVVAPANDTEVGFQYHHKIIKTFEALPFFTNLFDNSAKSQALSKVKVGIIDSGVDLTHADLSGLTGSKNVNLSNSCRTGICNFHGTFVAGVIAATRNNSFGVSGIAPNAVIFSYQIGDSQGRLATDEIANALAKAKEDQVEILNLSLGGNSFGDKDATMQAAMVELINNNTLIVVAAGNSNQNIDLVPTYPASYGYEAVTVVAAASPVGIPQVMAEKPTDAQIFSEIRRDSFSNYSPTSVHIAAPGRQIYSTTWSSVQTNATGASDGTSFSTPIITAAYTLMKGYLKVSDFSGSQISPFLMKNLLLENSDLLPSLSENINGTLVTISSQGRFVNLKKMSDGLKTYVDMIKASPSSISISKFEVVGTGAAKSIRLIAEVVDANPALVPVLRLYTNRSFKEESLIGTSCEIVQARTFCEFEISFSSLYVDPELYFEITDPKGTVISSLLLSKEMMNFGSKDEAVLDGEITELLVESAFEISGWACLVNFVDTIDLEIRKESADGPIVPEGSYSKTLKLPAKGKYFQKCASAEVNLGFRISIGSPGKYFVIAKHPTRPELNIVLPVVSYAQGFQDPQVDLYTDHVELDKNWISKQPDLVFVNRSFVGRNFLIEGTICRKGVYRPTPMGIQLSFNNVSFMKDNEPAGTDSTLAALEIGYAQRSARTVNQDYQPITPLDLGTHTRIGSFNATNFEVGYNGKKYQLDMRSQGDPFLAPPEEMTESGNCLVPDKFVINADLNKLVPSLTHGVVLSYAKEKWTADAVIAAAKLEELVAYMKTAQSTMDKIKLSPFHFPIVLPNGASLFEGLNSANSSLAFPESYSNNFILRIPASVPINVLDITPIQVFQSGLLPLKKSSSHLRLRLLFDEGQNLGAFGRDFKVEYRTRTDQPFTEAKLSIAASGGINFKGIFTPYSGYMSSELELLSPGSEIQIRVLSNNRNNFRLKDIDIDAF